MSHARLQHPAGDLMLKGCRRSRPEPRRVTRGKGDRRESCQQNHQRVAEDYQEPDKPAAPAFLRNLVRADGTRSRLRPPLASGPRESCAATEAVHRRPSPPHRGRQGKHECYVPLPLQELEMRRRRKSLCGASGAGVRFCGGFLHRVIRIGCHHPFSHRHLRHLFRVFSRLMMFVGP